MLQFIFGLIRGLWPLWVILILFFIYKKMVKPVSLKNIDPHDWNRILQTLQKKNKQWSNQLPAKINTKIADIINILGDFVPKINNKYAGTIIASEINKFMIHLFELVEEYFDMSQEKRNEDSSLLSDGLNRLLNKIQKVVETYDKGEENEFIAVVKQITGENSLEA